MAYYTSRCFAAWEPTWDNFVVFFPLLPWNKRELAMIWVCRRNEEGPSSVAFCWWIWENSHLSSSVGLGDCMCVKLRGWCQQAESQADCQAVCVGAGMMGIRSLVLSVGSPEVPFSLLPDSDSTQRNYKRENQEKVHSLILLPLR